MGQHRLVGGAGKRVGGAGVGGPGRQARSRRDPRGSPDGSFSHRIPAMSRPPPQPTVQNSRRGLRSLRLGHKRSPLRLHRIFLRGALEPWPALCWGVTVQPHTPGAFFGRQNSLRPFMHLRYQPRNRAKTLSRSLEGRSREISDPAEFHRWEPGPPQQRGRPEYLLSTYCEPGTC